LITDNDDTKFSKQQTTNSHPLKKITNLEHKPLENSKHIEYSSPQWRQGQLSAAKLQTTERANERVSHIWNNEHAKERRIKQSTISNLSAKCEE